MILFIIILSLCLSKNSVKYRIRFCWNSNMNTFFILNPPESQRHWLYFSISVDKYIIYVCHTNRLV